MKFILDDNEAYESDTDMSVCTNDTSATNDTTNSVDSLLENVNRFPEDKDDAEEVFKKPKPMPENLQGYCSFLINNFFQFLILFLQFSKIFLFFTFDYIFIE